MRSARLIRARLRQPSLPTGIGWPWRNACSGRPKVRSDLADTVAQARAAARAVRYLLQGRDATAFFTVARGLGLPAAATTKQQRAGGGMERVPAIASFVHAAAATSAEVPVLAAAGAESDGKGPSGISYGSTLQYCARSPGLCTSPPLHRIVQAFPQAPHTR